MKLLIIVAFLVISASCQRGAPSEERSARIVRDENQSIEDGRLRATEGDASRTASARGLSYSTVKNTRDLYARLSLDEQTSVRAFYSQYGKYVMDFARTEQLVWMQKNKYPLPQDIIDAAILTDLELEKSFNAGDTVAGFLYYDRMITNLQVDKDFPDSSQLEELEGRLLATGSPFAGYSIARRHNALDHDLNSVAGGLAIANYRGDYRAGRELAELTNLVADRDPARMDAASAILAFSVYLGVADLLHRGVDSGRTPMPGDSDR